MKYPLKFTPIIMIVFSMYLINISCNRKKNDSSFSILDCNIIAEKVSINGVDSLVVCDLENIVDTFDIPLSSICSDIDYVQLSNKKTEALIKSDGDFSVSNNYIGIYSSAAGKYILFNRNGDYVSTIASRGDGPDDFPISIYDSYIDEVNNRIFLLPMSANKLLVFDLKGNALPSIPFPSKVHKGRFLIDYNKQTVLLTVMPFPDSPSIIWKQDFHGNILQEIPSRNRVLKYPDYSNEVNYSFNNTSIDFSLFHWTPQPDTLYHYDEVNNELKSVFTIKIQKEMKQHDYIELPGCFLVRIIDSEKYDNKIVYIDKRTLRGCFVRFKLDKFGGIDVPASFVFNRGYFLLNAYPHELKEQFDSRFSKEEIASNELIEEMYSGLTDDCNNIILIGKLQNDKALDAKFSMPEKPIKFSFTGKSAKDSLSGDERIYGFKDLKDHVKWTPALDNAKEYFRKNNKYLKWDVNDKKETHIGCIVEKNGKTSSVKVMKSSGNSDLDNEAIRLIKEAVMLPGTNNNDVPIRCGDVCIIVYFPPK